MPEHATDPAPADLDSLSARLLADLDAPDDIEEEPAAPADAPAEPAAPAEEAPSEQPPEDAPDEEPEALSEPAATAAPTAPSAPAAPAPYTVRAGGKAHTLDGVAPQADGSLRVSPEGRTRVEQLLNRGLYHESTWRAEREEYERRLAEHDAAAERGTQLNQFFSALLDQGPEAIASFLDDFAGNRRELEYQMRVQALAAREQGASGATPADAGLAERIQAGVQQALPRDVASVAEDAFPGLFGAEDYPRIAALLAPQSEQFYLVAERDYAPRELPPGLAAAYPQGIRAGELLVDTTALQRALSAHAAPIQRERQRAAADAAAAKAALERNAKRNGASGAPAPTVPAGGAAAVPPTPRRITSFDEWQDALMDDTD